MKLKFEDTARRSTKKYHTFSKSAGDILNPASCSGAGRELFTLSRSSSSERKSFKRKKKKSLQRSNFLSQLKIRKLVSVFKSSTHRTHNSTAAYFASKAIGTEVNSSLKRILQLKSTALARVV